MTHCGPDVGSRSQLTKQAKVPSASDTARIESCAPR
jgi:hypothetical protein